MANDAMIVVQQYLEKKMLAKLGYSLDYNELEDWEAQAYSIIANTLSKEETRDLKSKRRK